jgi:hypothetical protein
VARLAAVVDEFVVAVVVVDVVVLLPTLALSFDDDVAEAPVLAVCVVAAPELVLLSPEIDEDLPPNRFESDWK